MTEKAMDSMPLVLFGLVIVGILAAFVASVMLPSPGIAASNGAAASYGTADNGKTISIRTGTTFKVILDENPSTGYSWNTTVTSGLKVTDSTYIQGGSPGLAGAGGTHEWTVQATGKGEQQFSAIYKRPWEPTTGSESAFTLKVSVV